MFESEERRIVRRIKDFIKSGNPSSPPYIYIMLRDGRILHIHDYRDMVKSGKINPKDAYVYFAEGGYSSKAGFYYPFLIWYNKFLDAYLSKLGFYYESLVVPATGLKYVAITIFYKKYLTIEVSNLDTVVNNTNLRKIVLEVLGEKLVSGEKELTGKEFVEIGGMFSSQLFFAGHNSYEAFSIAGDFFNKGNKSLVKEVARIAADYYRIFNPYTVCYDTRTWDEVVCSLAKF